MCAVAVLGCDKGSSEVCKVRIMKDEFQPRIKARERSRI